MKIECNWNKYMKACLGKIRFSSLIYSFIHIYEMI